MKMLILVCILTAGMYAVNGNANDIRLVNGTVESEGRVEILVNGTWGTVCDDYWDLNDAMVVCRQLGYPAAIADRHWAYFGAGSGLILLDDVQCNGNELSLIDCGHRDIGIHNCFHSEDAGVQCTTNTVHLDTIENVEEGTDTFVIFNVFTTYNVKCNETVTLSVDTDNSTAVPGYDFEGSGEYNCTIPDFSSTCSISVKIYDDNLIEPDEAVTVNLVYTGIMDIGNDTQTFWITMDTGDTEKVELNFRDSTYEIDEGGTLIIDLDFTDDNGLPTVINGDLNFLETYSSPTLRTATPVADYVVPVNQRSFPKADVSTSFPLQTLNDGEIEATEILFMSLSQFDNSMYVKVGALITETAIRIRDDDREALICLSTTPETFRRSSAPFTFYAVSNKADIVDAVKWKKRNLPPSKGTLTVMNDGSTNYAQKLTINKLNKSTRRRFGHYTFESGARSCTSFIRAQTDVLNYPPDVAQKYTMTIYPNAAGSTALSSPVVFGISYSATRKRNNLKWMKGNRQIGNTRTTLTVRDTSAAGIYEISRNNRGSRGWFAIIQLIAADCPINTYKDGQGECQNTCSTVCLNGGTCDSESGLCICPPCFEGVTCELLESTVGKFGIGTRYSCDDFGLNSECKGVLFSYEGNYGSTCGCGWSGTDCAERCDRGTFGADCTQTCHCDDNNFCDRRTGVCETGTCEAFYSGENCQIHVY